MNGLLKRGMMSLLVGMTMIAPLTSSIAHAADVTTAGIFGRATLADSTPLRGVALTLGDSNEVIARTTADGKYTISGLALKSYTVHAALKGYTFSEAVTVTLPTKGKPTSPNAEANFVGTVQNNIVLSGLIRTHDGVAVAGVSVALTGASSKTTTTSSLGTYRFDGLSLGQYTVTPTLSGYTFDRAYRNINLPFPATDDGPNGKADFFAIPIVVPVKSRIFGRITNTEGNPVRGINIYLGSSSTRVAVTDPDGKYVISNLLKGRYDVSPGREGSSFIPVVRTVEVPTKGKPTSPDAEANFVLAPTVAKTYSISGHVTANGEPVSAAKIYLNDNTVSSFTTGQAGTFLISKLPAGRLVVRVRKGDLVFLPADVVLSLPTTGQDASPNAVINFGVDLPKTYAIRGKVTLKDQGVRGVGIFLGDNSSPSATTGSDGTYAIEDLPADSYVVKAKLDDATFTPASVAVALPTQGANDSSDGVANFVEQPVVAATYSVHGHVSNNDGMVSGVSIYVNDSASAAAVTGADGLYSITGLPAGTVILTPKKAGVAFDPVNKAVTFPTTGTPNSPNAEVNFAAKPPATNTKYLIRGRVTNSGGTPLAGVDIRIADAVVATTGVDGRYAVESLDAGTYTVTPRKTNFTFAPVSVSITLPTTTGGALPNAEVNFTSNEAAKTYSITGLVKTSDGIATAGVSIYTSTSDGPVATTNSEGRYTIIGLVAGTYTLYPYILNGTFVPASASVVLPVEQGAGAPNATRDFIVTVKRK